MPSRCPMLSSNLTNTQFYFLPSPSNQPFFCLPHNLAVTRFPWSLKAGKQKADIVPSCPSLLPALMYLALFAGGLCYAIPSHDGFLSPAHAILTSHQPYHARWPRHLYYFIPACLNPPMAPKQVLGNVQLYSGTREPLHLPGTHMAPCTGRQLHPSPLPRVTGACPWL